MIPMLHDYYLGFADSEKPPFGGLILNKILRTDGKLTKITILQANLPAKQFKYSDFNSV